MQQCFTAKQWLLSLPATCIWNVPKEVSTQAGQRSLSTSANSVKNLHSRSFNMIQNNSSVRATLNCARQPKCQGGNDHPQDDHSPPSRQLPATNLCPIPQLRVSVKRFSPNPWSRADSVDAWALSVATSSLLNLSMTRDMLSALCVAKPHAKGAPFVMPQCITPILQRTHQMKSLVSSRHMTLVLLALLETTSGSLARGRRTGSRQRSPNANRMLIK